MISGRFGVVVSQKTAAQAAPVLGAISGAVINLAFTNTSRLSRTDISSCGG